MPILIFELPGCWLFFSVIIFIVGKIAVFEPDSVRVVLFWTFAGLTESH